MSIVTKKLISNLSKNPPLPPYSLPIHHNIHVACSTSASREGKEGRAADDHADEKKPKGKAEREGGGGLKEKTKETVEAAAGETKEEIRGAAEAERGLGKKAKETMKEIPKKVKESAAGAKESIEDAVEDVARPAEERREKPVDQSEMHVDRRAIDERKH